ncbi:DUF2461 domain-containing protein [Mucilaginibacter sp. SP1R1]|uniref:DUF2461 domain-containing protein n=1 Tax=Mucilaginibacter sp. SP1R1 TaxID=2723091 RepID=UPI001617E3DA|nr:DUF2461 domain-containing protein [Mucilaginibacter sp. SP1R1]MBB6150824.1 uncharacterized protein (TIGR02453 family) [Mucilaginibacter sp. SP1R1]
MIHQESLEFLKDLVNNNNREWFLDNKDRYDKARENVIEFTAQLLGTMHKVDPGIDEALDPKKCVMRIYRDIRFSKNKTPYKNNFGISLPTTGLRPGGAEYYLQIQPGGNSFIGGGYWMPEAPHLKAIRQEIDYNARDLKQIIDAPEFIKLFGDFRKQEQLKSVPREYGADNENIDLLKLKSFVAWHKITDKEIVKNNAADEIAGICSYIHPLNVFLRNALA